MRRTVYQVTLLLLIAILVVTVAPSGVSASPQPTTDQAISAASAVQRNCVNDQADLELRWYFVPRGRSSQAAGSTTLGSCNRGDITVLSSTPLLGGKQG